MAKHFSFVAENVTPLSQNNRSTARLKGLKRDLTLVHNAKYFLNALPRIPRITGPLLAKLFYIHRNPDFKDADNISKPLWDSLNNHAYKDDRQIKYLETLKIDVFTPDIFELDITNIEKADLEKLMNFVDNAGNAYSRFMYVEISDYESKKVRF